MIKWMQTAQSKLPEHRGPLLAGIKRLKATAKGTKYPVFYTITPIIHYSFPELRPNLNCFNPNTGYATHATKADSINAGHRHLNNPLGSLSHESNRELELNTAPLHPLLHQKCNPENPKTPKPQRAKLKSC